MLTIKDLAGVDLVANPPADVNYRAVGDQAIQVSIDARIIEDDPFLVGAFVNGTLDWNDGSLCTTYAPTSGTLTISASKGLTNGNYLISVYGSNYKSPREDQVRVNFPVSVVQQATRAEPAHLIYGPILPRDSGFPNPDQWDFNTNFDLLILESSVRMLLLTSKGERLMEPDYGTNLRRILFEQNVAGVESLVQEEIVRALTTWEPRLQLQAISIQKTDPVSLTVNASFLSKLSMQGFNINLRFVR